MNASTGPSIGVDVGGTSIKAAVISPAGELLHRERVASQPAAATGEGLVRTLSALLQRLHAYAPGAPVGLGVPGLVDTEQGLIRRSPNFPQWRDVPVRQPLRALGLTAPLALDNDANAAGLAEAAFGEARGASSFAFFTLGTGVGGALILGGELWRGARGYAGELGHIGVMPGGRQCGCGARGCLEQYASLNGLAQDVRARPRDFDDAEALAARADLPERLARMAASGHAPARACFERLGDHLGRGVASLLNALDVERVVFGGGVAETWDWFVPALRHSVLEHTFAPIADAVTLHRSRLGPDAGLYGAAALARALAR